VDYLDALDERARYSRVWQGFFEGYDVLLTPMMQMTALPLGMLAPTHIAAVEVDPFFDDWCEFCFPANLTDAGHHPSVWRGRAGPAGGSAGDGPQGP
jgi:Asp-tRNA(Asn)/Glu-tRNA(Gln) amidotransferase A subunit family amidase